MAELTSKMSQFMEVMMGQQSLLMTLANVVPRAPKLPTGPIAGQPVVPQPVPHGQPHEVWDVDAVSRDASDAEPLFEEGTEPEVASQHCEHDDPEVLDTNDPMCQGDHRSASGSGHRRSSRRNHGAVKPPIWVYQHAANPRLQDRSVEGGALEEVADHALVALGRPLHSGEAMASSSYYGNPDYSDPYGATGRREAPPPDLCDKEPSARTGKRRTWGLSAPEELPQVPPRQPPPQPQQPQQGP
ncbi:UNVERIFIED_CONTAM: hypothetical protein FKN15_016356 [Acipenser sinensis]